jgi:hypothetical protein
MHVAARGVPPARPPRRRQRPALPPARARAALRLQRQADLPRRDRPLAPSATPPHSHQTLHALSLTDNYGSLTRN